MKAIVTDLSTGKKVEINLEKNPVLHRVMKRAVSLYKQAKELGITGITIGYYVRYSWQLEKGHVWATRRNCAMCV